MLGKYSDGGISYVKEANGTSSNYFDLGSEWNEVKSQYNLTDKDMFELFNKPALDNAISTGKKIEFSHNPINYPDSALEEEWKYLKSRLNLTDKNIMKEGGKWYVKR
ncbi:MAG: hypothetical protein FWF14_02320 [Streptococcaceae bacterium]|nr:hypothetical protein [Streptococcaceae bacterium]